MDPIVPAPHLFSGAAAPALHPDAPPPPHPHPLRRPNRVLVTQAARVFPCAGPR